MKESCRKLRILIAAPGLDDHDRVAMGVARAIADAGHEVVYAGMEPTPANIASAAVQEAVDAVGLSFVEGAHMTLFPAIVDALGELGAGDIVVFGGGSVPDDDATFLLSKGVARIFETGAGPQEIGQWVTNNVHPQG